MFGSGVVKVLGFLSLVLPSRTGVTGCNPTGPKPPKCGQSDAQILRLGRFVAWFPQDIALVINLSMDGITRNYYLYFLFFSVFSQLPCYQASKNKEKDDDTFLVYVLLSHNLVFYTFFSFFVLYHEDWHQC